jgi:hypothetical protein
LAAKCFGKRDLELISGADTLLDAVGSSSLLVSVTSPLNLLKELFTVKGAGTLIKAGTEIQRRDAYTEQDVARLRPLLEESFGRTLSPDFFERRPLAVYIEASYRGAAILHAATPAPYLSKFAVLPEAQGEGIGHDLWHAIERDFPPDFATDEPELRAAYGVDWTRVYEPAPSLLVRPRSTDEVSRFLALCHRHHVPVVPSGGRTGLAGGAVAARGEVVLSLERMRRMDPVDENGLTGLTHYMRGDTIVISVSLMTGDESATVWGCDLTDGYVRINADYTT